MKQKKSSKVIIIAIIIMLILIIGIGVAYAYMATDLLKSNKKLFFNYLSQIGDTSEYGFIETNLTKYFEKKENTPYKNDGEFNVKITAPEEYMPTMQPTNRTNIAFNGEIDAVSSKAMQNISINYSNDVNFEFIYKQIGSVYGIQNDYVSKKYIAIDTEKNTSNLFIDGLQKNIGKIRNVASTPRMEDEARNLLNKYMEVLNQELQESNEIGYKLSLTGEQLKNITIKILETAKNDQELLEKINEQSTETYTTEDIEDMINELNDDTEVNGKNIEITVYQNLRKLSKIKVLVDTAKIEIAKNNEAGELQYNISFEQQQDDQTKFKAYLDIKFAGLATQQNINENYKLGIEFPIEDGTCPYEYNFNNDVTFEETSNIEEFTDDNCLNLTSLEEEKANQLTTAILERLQLVNKKIMEELGLDENSNPLINMLPTMFLTYGMETSTISDEMNQVTQTEIATFNSQYELYESTNLKGTTVKGLLTTIAKNNGLDDESEEDSTNSTDKANKDNKRLIEEINFNGEEYEVNLQNLTIIRGEVSTEDYYRVEFEKNEDGAIYRAVINKK